MPVNENFIDFPIDFFSFNEENFNPANEEKEYLFTSEKLELEEGFIGNSLFEKIDFDTKETCVVNCAVGQGKTHAILHSIKEYLNTEDSIDTFFVIAVPLVSLVTQYQKDLIDMGFEENQIFSYESISDEIPESGESYRSMNCKIHIVTVNTLLGNAGENSILQSERKYNYIKAFAEDLSTHGKQLIIIYDEIHEAIRNFSETGIAYLWHFQSTIWKNILISATYNVQSVPVIKLLAKQTNKKIRILEADRVISKPQSKLHLYFNNEYSSTKYSIVTDLVLNLINKEKTIDILSYSKTLCNNLLDTNNDPGNSLTEKFGELKACVSTIEHNQGDNDEDLTRNRFDNNFCNIGTNFKSGVNINKENHAFIIILPPASSRSTYANFNGIFSEGPNAVIQALARQRTVGEIHVILPKPIIMDYDSLPDYMTPHQKEVFSNEFSRVSIPVSDVPISNNVEVRPTEYIPFSKHIDIVNNWWGKLQERYEMPMTLNSELELPSYDNFVIANGEKCTTKTNFLGKDISGFVVYSAFTNQFFNAKLESLFIPEVVTPENILEHIENVYESLEREHISDTLISVERALDLTQFNASDKRSAKQIIFKYVTEKQNNVQDISNLDHLGYKFIISFFNRFSRENPTDLERQILRYREIAATNIISRSHTRFYQSYRQNQVFSGHAVAIRAIVGRLKEIHPLNKDYANFFDSYNSLSDLQLEKKFYEFIIAITSETIRRQTTVNGVHGSYQEIIRDY